MAQIPPRYLIMEEKGEISNTSQEDARHEIHNSPMSAEHGGDASCRVIPTKSNLRLVLVTIALMSAGFLVALDINILGRYSREI